MFGDDVLVAPVLEPRVDTWPVYLPGTPDTVSQDEITASSALSQPHCPGDLGAPLDRGGGCRRPHRDCARPPGQAAGVLQEGVPVVTTIPGYWQHVWLKNN